jgi:Fur family transcriptional regulator, zinc uptake regulator
LGQDHKHEHQHAHHDHHHHHGDALAAAEAHCAAKGLKLTDMRRQVFESLAAAPGALGAYDLIDALASTGHKRLAPVSIYRALDFLMEAGLAHKIESLNAFVACPHLHGPHEMVVFLICDACGKVEESTSDNVAQALSSVARGKGFIPRGQVIEMHGRCAACSGASDGVMTA